ncbi:hypothetical protein QBZ16_002892 [Prototheca wickerhamii]|uniref:Amidase domain-containing protein n=1 Tax=Prototheca wickerhamii TaxID=3111 RepID=A0AAD9MNP4_PROWI|nr:hypothetical protein QBZ16_002892 [Prototheca wickerhamii]
MAVRVEWSASPACKLLNPQDKTRWHGGGEAAAAAAVSSGLVDVAVATDELGSCLIPAACCGAYCLRMTAPSLPGTDASASTASTAIFVRDESLLSRLAASPAPGILPAADAGVASYLVAVDLFAECCPATMACLPPVIQAVKRWAGNDQAQSLSLIEWIYHRMTGLRAFFDDGANHGSYGDGRTKAVLCALRKAGLAAVSPDEAERAKVQPLRAELASGLLAALQDGYIFVLPTTTGQPLPWPARRDADSAAMFESNAKAFQIFVSLAALAGVPQVTVPFADPTGIPLSISLLGLHRKDATLAAAAARLGPLVQEEVWRFHDTLDHRGPGGEASAAAPPPRGRAAAAAAAEACKGRGNAAFQAGRYEEALAHYSQAIDLDTSNAVCFNNRALVHLKLGQYGAAEADAEASLKLARTAKALLRRGSARMALGETRLAAEDFEQVLALEPNNRQARDELKAIQRFLGDQELRGL